MPRGDELDALIQRAQSGDVRAFETLLADHLAQVRRFARAFAASDADADDLAQEALVKAYRNLKLFRYQSAFSTWLYSIVRNAFLDAAKSRAGRERAQAETLKPEHTDALEGVSPADEQLHREQERQRLWAALRAVAPEFRSAIVLFDIEGLSYDEVASVEGVPVGTVKSRLNRGRAALRRLLGEPEEEEPGTEPVATSSQPSRRGS